MKQQLAQKIIDENKAAYEKISADFDASRKRLWKGFDEFLPWIQKGDAVLDSGCGNGRLISLFENCDIQYTGMDNNKSLLERAQKNHPGKKFVLGDVLQLPFKDQNFDAIFSIAVLHHIPSKELRLKAMREMHRVLKKGGVLIMTNWNRFNWHSAKYLIQFTLQKLIGQNKLDFKDIFLPWGNSGQKRYYHCFTLGELKRLCKRAGFQVLEQKKQKEPMAHYTAHNLVIIARK